jgi:GDPmannose 4,6-dehydratase
MFGEVKKLPITEDTEFHPKSPYAISKAAAHWTCVNYRESYGMFICCGILFNHESYLRNENFFVKKVIANAIKIKDGELNELSVGDLSIRRDIGFAPKYVEAMYKMMQQPEPGNYIICSGKSVSLRYIVEYVFSKLGLPVSKIITDPHLFRPSEIHDIYGSNQHINQSLNWSYDISTDELLDILIEEEIRNRKMQ